MAEITASMVKELREKTGAGMMECKKALGESGGNMEQAVDELRKRGQAIADKKAGRATREGLIFAKCEGAVGALVEINCESDFVARNEAFLALGAKIAAAAFNGPANLDGDALLDAPLDGKTVREVLTASIATIGENLGLGRVVRFEVQGAGAIASYIHPPGKLGVLVELRTGKAETASAPALAQLGRDIAMQVAAAMPLAVNADGIPADALEREKKIFEAQCEQDGKPQQMWEKIIAGKVAKFYKDACLLDQIFIKDNELTVAKLVAKVAKELGDTVEVARFERVAVGAKVEAEAEA